MYSSYNLFTQKSRRTSIFQKCGKKEEKRGKGDMPEILCQKNYSTIPEYKENNKIPYLLPLTSYPLPLTSYLLPLISY
jgi:hypothetical protein